MTMPSGFGDSLKILGSRLTLNGLVTTVKTAPEVLQHLMDPLNIGITVGRSLVP